MKVLAWTAVYLGLIMSLIFICLSIAVWFIKATLGVTIIISIIFAIYGIWTAIASLDLLKDLLEKEGE